MDVEAFIRNYALERLLPWFTVEQEVTVCLAQGGFGRVDLLCRPVEPCLNAVSFAVEVKKREYADDDLGYRVKQAADYVGAVPCNRSPPVAASFLWLTGQKPPTVDTAIRAQLSLAGHFRVGTIIESRRGLEFHITPHQLFAEARGDEEWLPKAREVILAARTYAGVRRSLAAQLQAARSTGGG